MAAQRNHLPSYNTLRLTLYNRGMIIVSVNGVGEVEIDAGDWTNDGDGDLDCTSGDRTVATFPRGQWLYVHQDKALTRRTRSFPIPPRPGPGR